MSVKLVKQYKNTSKVYGNPVKNVSIRLAFCGKISYESQKNSFHKWLSDVSEKAVYQLEMTKVINDEIYVSKNPQCKIGDTHDNYHIQCGAILKDRKSPKALAIKMNSIFNGIEIAPAVDIMNLFEYCQKNDTRIEGPFYIPEDSGPKPPKILSKEKGIYTGKDLAKMRANPYLWQSKLKDEIVNGDPGDRKVIWIYDKQGNNGKTKWKKMMKLDYGAVHSGWCNSRDMMCFAINNISKCYIFDLGRTKPYDISDQDVYACVEALKDGCISNGKFMPESEDTDPPWVVVLANITPNMDRLTGDRWDIRVITEDRDLAKWNPDIHGFTKYSNKTPSQLPKTHLEDSDKVRKNVDKVLSRKKRKLPSKTEVFANGLPFTNDEGSIKRFCKEPPIVYDNVADTTSIAVDESLYNMMAEYRKCKFNK